MKTKLVSALDIERIVCHLGTDALMDRLIENLYQGFRHFDPNLSQIPARSGLDYSEPDLGLLEWMPAAVKNERATLKIVGYHPSNPSKRNLPTILSTLYAFDTKTGHLDGILDGTFPTAIRTGAMSAIASWLSANTSTSITLGLIGAGAQAVTQVHALSRFFEIKEVLVYDRSRTASTTIKNRLSFLNINLSVFERNELSTMLKRLDILCTCTSEDPGNGPVLPDFENKPHLHINAIGSDFPGKFELPLPLLKRAIVCPDFLDQALKEGECQQLPSSEVAPEFHHMLSNSDGTQNHRDSLTVFDSTGHAYADYLTTQFFLEHAKMLNLGVDIEIESSPTDPLDPYSFMHQGSKLRIPSKLASAKK